jgi:hypothetical protein
MVIHSLEVLTGRQTIVPGSNGLWTARWSPDGHYLLALTPDSKTVMVLDAITKRWKRVAQVGIIENPAWSRDSAYVFGFGRDDAEHPWVYRVRIADGRVDTMADVSGVPVADGGPWFGVAPDNTIIGLRGFVLSDVWALDCVLP